MKKLLASKFAVGNTLLFFAIWAGSYILNKFVVDYWMQFPVFFTFLFIGIYGLVLSLLGVEKQVHQFRKKLYAVKASRAKANDSQNNMYTIAQKG